MPADRSMQLEDFSLTGGISPFFDKSAQPARDPRIDPQPGDILAVDRDVREVFYRVQNSIEYGFPRRAATRWLPLLRWQAWARLAEVRKVAP